MTNGHETIYPAERDISLIIPVLQYVCPASVNSHTHPNNRIVPFFIIEINLGILRRLEGRLRLWEMPRKMHRR